MHEHFLTLALQQAQKGRGMCAPNPSVGAVAVRNNTIIAHACHLGAGKPHAEVLALAQFPPHTPDVTLYITLEPCNHWGRTPPCVDAIINHGISRVVYAFADPNPLVQQISSASLLQENGVSVVHYPLPIINQFYASYAYWTQKKLPFVTVKMAQSLDGKIALSGNVRVQLSNAESAVFTHTQRQAADVILTSAQTAINDDPWLNVRLADVIQDRPIALLDRRLRVNQKARCLQAKNIHIYHQEGLIEPKKLSNCTYHAVALKENQLDLHAVLSHLGSIGYHDVFVEAGARLFNALHQQALVNRTYLYVVPTVLGQDAVDLYTCNDFFKRKHSVIWAQMADNVRLQIDWE